MIKMFEKSEVEVLASETEYILEVLDVGRKNKNKKLTKEEFRNLWLREVEYKWMLKSWKNIVLNVDFMAGNLHGKG